MFGSVVQQMLLTSVRSGAALMGPPVQDPKEQRVASVLYSAGCERGEGVISVILKNCGLTVSRCTPAL